MHESVSVGLVDDITITWTLNGQLCHTCITGMKPLAQMPNHLNTRSYELCTKGLDSLHTNVYINTGHYDVSCGPF